MADKRITDLPTATTISVDKFMVVDSAADGTEKGTIGAMYEAIEGTLAAYGAIYTTEASATQALTANTGAKLTLFDTDGIYQNITVSHANDQLTIGADGKYQVTAQFSFTSNLSNVTYLFHVAVDGVRQEPGTHRKVGTGGDVGSCSITPLFLDLTTDQVLTIEVEASSNVNLTIIDAHFGAHRIG